MTSPAGDYLGCAFFEDAICRRRRRRLTDDTVLDLNLCALEMSEYCYCKQRWFTTQYFLAAQGFGSFDGALKMASNVERIKLSHDRKW